MRCGCAQRACELRILGDLDAGMVRGHLAECATDVPPSLAWRLAAPTASESAERPHPSYVCHTQDAPTLEAGAAYTA
jgi:hypothetical protein